MTVKPSWAKDGYNPVDEGQYGNNVSQQSKQAARKPADQLSQRPGGTVKINAEHHDNARDGNQAQQPVLRRLLLESFILDPDFTLLFDLFCTSLERYYLRFSAIHPFNYIIIKCSLTMDPNRDNIYDNPALNTRLMGFGLCQSPKGYGMNL